jgi:hypothetical protein
MKRESAVQIFRAIFNFYIDIDEQADTNIYVAFRDGSSAILYTVNWMEGEPTAGAKWIARSDGTDEKYGSIDVDDVIWGDVVSDDRMHAIRDSWEKSRLLREATPERFPRSYARLADFGLDVWPIKHAIAMARKCHVPVDRSRPFSKKELETRKDIARLLSSKTYISDRDGVAQASEIVRLVHEELDAS